MIAHFDNFCLWVYVLIDDICKELEGHLRGPGPEPECRDSELIANCLIGECLGWDVETVLLSHMQAHRESHPPAHQIAQKPEKTDPRIHLSPLRRRPPSHRNSHQPTQRTILD